MNRIPPAERIRKQIVELYANGIEGDYAPVSMLLRLGAQRLVQELLEQEVTEHLGRDYYERRDPGEPATTGYRNGYKPGKIRTSEGRINVEIPQVRNTNFESRVLAWLRHDSDVLTKLVAEMYARGLSTRDIEDAFRESAGDPLISKSSVSRITEVLWEEYEAFSKRSLAGFNIVYLFLDAVYESLRNTAGISEGVLCAWGITAEGKKVLLHLALGNKESYECWLEFLRDMVRRGLQTPLCITTDGAPGLIKAVEVMWPKSLRIRCWAHKMRNVQAKVPEDIWRELKGYVEAVRDAPSYDEGRKRAQEVIAAYQRSYPSAIASFSDDLEASLAHLKLPASHRKYVRTTNLIERSFEEERRRSKVIPKFFDERSCLKLVFSVLWRSSMRWQSVRIKDVEKVQLDLLRKSLGLIPENSVSNDDHDKRSNQHDAVA